MPKAKTHQGASKRLRRTKSGKLMHRTSGQDHFNSRETGNTKTSKRRDSSLHESHKRLKTLLIHQ